MPVIYMDRASIESLTEKDIREIINENSTDVKYGMLHDYYVGNHRILGENKKDSTAPNNRLVNNMAKYITDTATGYFVGEPIVYDSQNDEYLQTVPNDFRAVSGYSIIVQETDTGLYGQFYIESDTHTFSCGKAQMDLTLAFENLMDEREIEETA